MATPQSTTSFGGGGNKPKQTEAITFRFCSECSNMLYPKEDPADNVLQFTCRTCQYSELAKSNCVFRNQLNNTAGDTAGVTQDVGADPTVGTPLSETHATTFFCLCCGNIVMCAICGDAPAINVPASPSITVTLQKEDMDTAFKFADLSDDYDFMNEDMDTNGSDDPPSHQRHLSDGIHA